MPPVRSRQRPWLIPPSRPSVKETTPFAANAGTRADQFEELYDHIADPREWYNPATQSEVLEQVRPTLHPGCLKALTRGCVSASVPSQGTCHQKPDPESAQRKEQTYAHFTLR